MHTDVVEKQSAVDKLSEPLWGYPEQALERLYGSRLKLSESAKVRLAAFAGYLLGLRDSNPADAERLASDLDRQLTYLSQYGGTTRAPFEGLGLLDEARDLPSFKVVLHDDGCFGSFAIAWYRPYSQKSILDAASAAMPEWWREGTRPAGVTDEHSDRMWDESLQKTYERFRVDRKDRLLLDEVRVKPEAYKDQPYYCRTEHFQYGFSFNGGLILHNPADPTKASFGVHT
jgi:hypothetical protein